ncbi:MAG: pyruvoyl-dependent arginine decarboxylase [Halobacteriaceae archaeon]
MSTIRIVWGTGSGPTPMAAYDAALADANVHDYNLVRVSSVVPADADLVEAGTAPSLGAIGDRLTVVEARGTAVGPDRAGASLVWGRRAGGAGLFYEASVSDAPPGEPPDAERRASEGLAAGRTLREWEFVETGARTVTVDPEPDDHGAAVVVAVYGRGDPIC